MNVSAHGLAAILFAGGVWAGAAVAAESEAKSASNLYEDRWFYSSRRIRGEADFAFYADVLAKARAGGYNGMLAAIGLDYYYAFDEKAKADFQRLRRMCDAAGIEIIPIIWSTGYGAFAGADFELAESEPVKDFPYAAKGGRAVFTPQPIALKNGDFSSYDAAKNRFAGWYADHPGVESFVDAAGGRGNGPAIRFDPAPEKDKYGHARLSQVVAVKPGRRYRFTVHVRAEDLVPKGGSGVLRVQVYGRGKKASNLSAREVNMLLKEEGWRKVSVDFASADYGEVILYVGTWGATAGRFWVDDCSLEEIGLREVCLRKGTPFSVRSAKTGRVYAVGRDYELPKARASKNADISFRILPGGAIAEGEALLVDAYVPARHGPKSQISTCMSDPRLYEKFEKSAVGVMEACAPRKWFLSVDEVRNGNTCPLCTARRTDMAHIFGECVTKMHAIIKKNRPDAVVYAWSDQFDPNHNAVDGYYGCKGTFAGVWDLVPKDIVMSCWYRKKRDLSVPFFTQHGFRVQAGAYYDSDDYRVDAGWMETLNRTPGATGWMYTTWNAKYELLEKYGRFMNENSRPRKGEPEPAGKEKAK